MGKRLIPVTYSLQQIPGISDFSFYRTCKRVHSVFPAFPAFFQKINRRFKNQVKAGFNIDFGTSVNQLFRRRIIEHQLIEFCCQIGHKQKFLSVKVLYLATCGGKVDRAALFAGYGSKWHQEKPAPFRVRA